MAAEGVDIASLLAQYGFPGIFIIGLKVGWWHMGEGVDPSWKDIALRSISTNETMVTELSKSTRRSTKAKGGEDVPT